MDWFKSNAFKVTSACFALIALQGYGLLSMRSTVAERMDKLEREVEAVRATGNTKTDQLASDLDVITNRMGITAQELKHARDLAEQLKQENARTTQHLQSELAAKADTEMVSQFKEEATSRLAEVQQNADSKIGTVSSDVQIVRTDLDATRQDVASSKKDLGDIRSEVARNGTELAALRRKGERDYIEFDMRKSNQFERIADVQIQLRKTDVKRQKYSVIFQADDNRIEKNDRLANEPVQFLVGRDRLRYEFVVNYVDRDRIRGYLSTPKDKVLAAEGPSGAQHPNQ
jgi:chromosome segregation ATPase